MQRTNIYLSEEQIARLDEVAAARRSSRADVVRELIDDGLATLASTPDERVAAIDISFGVLLEADGYDSVRREPDARQEHLDRMFQL